MATFIAHYSNYDHVERNPEDATYILVFFAILIGLCILVCSSGCMYHGQLGDLLKVGASSIWSCLCKCKRHRSGSPGAQGAADNVELGLLATPAASGANTPSNGQDSTGGVAPQAVVPQAAQVPSHGSPAPNGTAHAPTAIPAPAAPPPTTAQIDGAPNEHGNGITPLPVAFMANNDNVASPGVHTGAEWWAPSPSPLSGSRVHSSASTGAGVNPMVGQEPTLAAPLAPIHTADDDETPVNDHGNEPALAIDDDDPSEPAHEHFLTTDGFGHVLRQFDSPSEAGDEEPPSYAAAVAAGGSTEGAH